MIQNWYWATYNAIQDLWVGFLYFIPNFIGAVIVFVVGWFIASWAGIAVTKVLSWLKLNQVFAKGQWDEDEHVWTLELARNLVTADSERDVTFNLSHSRDYNFTLALADNSQRHYGSAAQVLRFLPR